MKKRIAALALSGALLLSGCGGSDPGPETKPTEPVSTVTATETTAPVQTVPHETETVIADDALSLLRADMKPHIAALGYLGYCDLENYDSPIEYLRGEFPNYLASPTCPGSAGSTAITAAFTAWCRETPMPGSPSTM